MKRLLTYIYGSLLCAVALLMVSSCNDAGETDWSAPDEPGSEGKVKIEMFTRLQGYDVPVSRANLANEDELEMTPWVLIFRDETENQTGDESEAVFVEAVKTIEMSAPVRRYVWLEHQTKRCWALLLANPQGKFYVDATTGYDFSEENLNNLLSGETLEAATAMLLTEPLETSRTTIPFIGQRMPMSYLHPMPNGINKDASIGLSDVQLELVRVPAKVVIKNSVSTANFSFDAVMSVMNVSGQSQLYNLSATPAEPGVRTIYKNASDNVPLVIPETISGIQSTANDPIYVYETPAGADNNGYIIIKAQYLLYAGTGYAGFYESYYKMEFIGADSKVMDIKRNYQYTFNISNVRGTGYFTLDDAIAGSASNNIDYEILITDASSYEIRANSDYYVALSNSQVLLHADPSNSVNETFHVATIITNNTADLPSLRLRPDGSIMLIDPSDGKVPRATRKDTPAILEIKIKFWGDNTLKDWEEERGRIYIEVGDLQEEWFIEVVRKPPLHWQGASGTEEPWWGSYKYYNSETNEFVYYMLSAEVEKNADTGIRPDWIKFSPSSDVFREDPYNVMVDDGKIHMHVVANNSTEARKATAMVSAIRNPDWDNPNSPGTGAYRIKYILHQRGIQ